MSVEAKTQQLKTIFEQFNKLDFDAFFAEPGTYSEWDGLNLDEFKNAIEFIKDIYSQAFEADIFHKLPFTTVNALTGSLNNSVQHCTQLLANKDQGHFQNAAKQVDNAMHQLMVYDVNYYVAIGQDIEEIKNVYDTESQKLSVYTTEIEALKNNVQSLIEPAVSGSLSKSFSDRKKHLFWSRVIWGVLSIGIACLAVYATYYISESIINTVTPAPSSEKTPDKAADLEKTISISMILLRSVVLIPIYLGFGFAFSQYRKERDLEEEYAHKSAVASSLPNYGDLAKDDNVKDQIVSGASNVIFASPINKVKQTETKSDVIESMKGLFETAGNAFKKE